MHTFFAFMSRMKYIKRWSLMHSTREENVAEHTCQTAIIAHALAQIGNTYFGKSHDADKAAAVALFHESSEVLTGDLPTPIKYFNKTMRKAYRDIEDAANSYLSTTLPPELSKVYMPLIESPAPEVYRLVKAADKISAYLKCMEEENAGNTEFAQAKAATVQDIAALGCEEADYFLAHFAPAFTLTLDQLGNK